MGEVKSAFERAMEKVEKVGKVSPEELKRMEYVPQGDAIAGRHLRGELTDLRAEFSRHDTEVRRNLVEGALETLIRNIRLLRGNKSTETSSKAMEGILTLKDDKGGIVAVLADETLNVRDLKTGPAESPPMRKHESEFVVGLVGPTTKPGSYGVFISVGKRDGTPQIVLPLEGDDGQRRYRLGAVILEDANAPGD